MIAVCVWGGGGGGGGGWLGGFWLPEPLEKWEG